MTDQHGDDGTPISGLRGLREVTPPVSLVPSVMRRVAEPEPATVWSWLLRRRRLELRVSPLGFGAGAFVGVVVVAVMLARPIPAPTATPVVASSVATPALATPALAALPEAAGDIVLVRFVLIARGARKVAVAGDFNRWNPDGTTLLNADGQGTFVATVRLPRGAHEYMFVVDGEWVTDPGASERRPDGFGRHNAVLRL
jgi:hypothetical protein